VLAGACNRCDALKNFKEEKIGSLIKYSFLLDWGNADEKKLGEKGLHDLLQLDETVFLAVLKLHIHMSSKQDWEGIVRITSMGLKKVDLLDRTQEEILLVLKIKAINRLKREAELKQVFADICRDKGDGLLVFYQIARLLIKNDVGDYVSAFYLLDHILDNLNTDIDFATIPYVKFWRARLYHRFSYNKPVEDLFS
jgi:hypothetical protein